MGPSEKFCLKWNDFQTNITSSFKDLRNDQEFTDVTLVCGDNHKIEAHKVILASASKVFRNIFTESKHPHPLIFIKGTNGTLLSVIIDYIYHGEANLLQDDLENFVELASELAVKGFTGSEEKQLNKPSMETNLVNSNRKSIISHKSHDMKDQNFEKISIDENTMVPFEHMINAKETPTQIKQKVSLPFKEDCELDEQIVSLLEHINGIWSCKLCGKTATLGKNAKTNLKKHVETHIEGITHPCGICGLSSKTRNALQVHMSIVHRGNNH